MKTYRILASSVEYLYLDIEAENEEEAWQIAYDSDGFDYKSQGLGDWQIDSVSPINEPYTCPKFEPAEEEQDDEMSKWVKQVNKDIREGIA